MTPRKEYAQIIQGFELILRATTGADLTITVTPENFDRDAFIEDCQRITAYVQEQAPSFMLTKPKTDTYYISLYICYEKYPYVSDKYFAQAFSRDRATVLQARHKIPELFKVDKVLQHTANTLLLQVFAKDHEMGEL